MYVSVVVECVCSGHVIAKLITYATRRRPANLVVTLAAYSHTYTLLAFIVIRGYRKRRHKFLLHQAILKTNIIHRGNILNSRPKVFYVLKIYLTQLLFILVSCDNYLPRKFLVLL